MELAQYISLNELHDDPDNVRSRLDGIDELADSIRAHGVLSPLLVTRTENGYRLVAGHRRAAAARSLGLQTVPAIVNDFGADTRAVQLVENVQREDLPALDVAEAVDELIKQGASVDSVAKQVGKSPNWVRRHLSLLKTDPKVIAAIRRNGLGFTQALAVMKVTKEQGPDAGIAAAAQLRSGGLSTRAAARALDEAPSRLPTRKTFTKNSQHHRLSLVVESDAMLDEDVAAQVSRLFGLVQEVVEATHVQR